MNDSVHVSIGSFIQTFVDWLNVNHSMPFELLSALMEKSVKLLEGILLFPHAFVVMVGFSIIAWRLAGRKVGGLTFGGLVFCYLMDLWKATMLTTALVGVSTVAALLVAIPLGIWSATNPTVDRITRPVMDLMQTLPPWVYLIPAVILFSLGRAPRRDCHSGICHTAGPAADQPGHQGSPMGSTGGRQGLWRYTQPDRLENTDTRGPAQHHGRGQPVYHDVPFHGGSGRPDRCRWAGR